MCFYTPSPALAAVLLGAAAVAAGFRRWHRAALPDGYAHAYRTAGGGCGYTWPVPLPVYAIDHCLHGPRVEPIRYHLGTGASTHRYQMFDFSLR